MKPYVTCFMMSSIDGRIDCDMTEQINGGNEYDKILASHHFDACLCGKITAKMHYAKSEPYICSNPKAIKKEEIYQAIKSNHYSVVVDTFGSLTWENHLVDDAPLIVLLSEQTSIEYTQYLKSLKISYIIVGKKQIDLTKALQYLYYYFNIKKLGVVGGGHINGAFLKDKLIDEISLLIGPAIDGREGMCALFDGLNSNQKPFKLKLIDLKKYENGAVWLLYKPEYIF